MPGRLSWPRAFMPRYGPRAGSAASRTLTARSKKVRLSSKAPAAR